MGKLRVHHWLLSYITRASKKWVCVVVVGGVALMWRADKTGGRLSYLLLELPPNPTAGRICLPLYNSCAR